MLQLHSISTNMSLSSYRCNLHTNQTFIISVTSTKGSAKTSSIIIKQQQKDLQIYVLQSVHIQNM